MVRCFQKKKKIQIQIQITNTNFPQFTQQWKKKKKKIRKKKENMQWHKDNQVKAPVSFSRTDKSTGINAVVSTATECQRLPLHPTFTMTKEQWQRSAEEKNRPGAPREERASKSNVPWNEYEKHSAAEYLDKQEMFKRKTVLLLFLSRWPLLKIPHGREWARLTWPLHAHERDTSVRCSELLNGSLS